MFRNLLLILLCILYVTGCGYSQKSFKVLVVDEKGTPIPRAEVLLTSGKSAGLIKQLAVQGVDFSGKGGSLPGKKILEKTYVADENGEVGFSKITGKNVRVRVSAEGYYVSADYDRNRNEIRIPLRKINKIENILIGEERKIVMPDQVYIYDFLVKDFLPPHGKGQTPDITFEYSDEPKINISGDNDGFAIMNFRTGSAYPHSEFKCPKPDQIVDFRSNYSAAKKIGSISWKESKVLGEGIHHEQKFENFKDIMNKIWFWTDVTYDHRPDTFSEVIFFRIRNMKYYGIFKSMSFFERRDGKIQVNFEYELNLDATESLEMKPCMSNFGI